MAEGLAVVFISHKLAEVRAISDRVTVLRRGQLVGTVDGRTDERELARMMVGRPSFGVERPDRCRRPRPASRSCASADLHATGHQGLSAAAPTCRSTSSAGEIVGVAGVSGNGQTELVEVLSGMRRPTGGSVAVGDTRAGGRRPRDG